MDQSQRSANGDSSNQTSNSSSLMPNVLFREIHKNAFLKRHSSDRRTGFPRKSERVWVVFCVHDDVEPFLEIYPDQKVALTHKPEWFASLSNVLHVSPTICGHEDEFEFAVTLSFQVIRLSAPSWDSMMEWVETIRNKLRELKVLCPKENLYSKMPEQKQPLLPTRDPNSPLPLPPEGPSTLLPGVEIVHLETRHTPAANDNNVPRNSREAHSRNNNIHERRVLKRRENHVEREPRSVSDQTQASDTTSNSNSSCEIPPSVNVEVVTPSVNSSCNLQPNKTRVKRAVSVPQPTPSTSNIPSGSNITVIEVSAPSTKQNHSVSECNSTVNSEFLSDNEDDVFITSINQKPDIKNSCAVNNDSEEAHYEHVFLPNTVVVKPQVPQSSDCTAILNCVPIDTIKCVKTHSTSVLITPNNVNLIGSSQDENVASTSNLGSTNIVNNKDVLINNSTCVNISRNSVKNEFEIVESNNPLGTQIQSKLEKVNISGFIPRLPAKSTKPSAFKPVPVSSRDSNLNILEARKSSSENHVAASTSGDQGVRVSNGEITKSSNVVTPVPAYSQVKKVPKSKVKNEVSRNEEHHSPIFPKRKVSEIQIVEVESHGNKKPECPPVNKSQSVSADGKSQKAIVGKKTESGNININKNLSNSQGSSKVDNRNEILTSTPSTSGSRVDNSTRINITKKESIVPCNNNPEIEPITATVQPAVGVITVEDIPLIGGHQRRRRRSSSSDTALSGNAPPTRGIGGADRIRVNVPLISNISSRETHRNEAETRSTSHIRNALEPNSHANISQQSTRLTLREQQVLQLKKEMLHPGGVRLQLRRKDCTGSIALVDVLNGVWVAGWKQKEHPLLYNALHIGDQLISIGEVVVRNSAEAQKLIRSSTSLYIEFIIRRVPFGNVFALQRSSEGQSLGIIQEGNTAEIKDVVPNSIAARQGLTSKTPSCDGLSLTTWFLTEINGRPLNLFFKDNEVRDRLNAVGKEISILVQPHDFIKQIKKQLKSMRSYKDYIVQ